MIEKQLKKIRKKQICVLGDVMLDIFSYGSINRISPEAPVPVLDIEQENGHLGGALNVCNNLISLGAGTEIIGVSGDDFEAFRLESLCEQAGINKQGLIRDHDRVTTCKTRYFDKEEPLFRVDREQRTAISGKIEKKLETEVQRALRRADACILQDYNKGVMTPGLIKSTLSYAKKLDVPVFVDPKFENVEYYAGAFFIKPNLREAESIINRKIGDVEDAQAAAEELFRKLSTQHILLTMGSEGMILKSADQNLYIPAHYIEMADITGAGDTVIAALSAFHSIGLSPAESAKNANLAAARVCSFPGVSAVSKEMLLQDR